MNGHYIEDPWSIIEDGFHPSVQKASESIFSLGNGHMGQRANFEEQYSGDTLQGNYLAGVYYPDKTRVGWSTEAAASCRSTSRIAQQVPMYPSTGVRSSILI